MFAATINIYIYIYVYIYILNTFIYEFNKSSGGVLLGTARALRSDGDNLSHPGGDYFCEHSYYREGTSSDWEGAKGQHETQGEDPHQGIRKRNNERRTILLFFDSGIWSFNDSSQWCVVQEAAVRVEQRRSNHRLRQSCQVRLEKVPRHSSWGHGKEWGK